MYQKSSLRTIVLANMDNISQGHAFTCVATVAAQLGYMKSAWLVECNQLAARAGYIKTPHSQN